MSAELWQVEDVLTQARKVCQRQDTDENRQEALELVNKAREMLEGQDGGR